MSETIKIDDLAATVTAVLNEYTTEVTEGIKEDVKAVGHECRQNIQQDSPKRTGKYAKSWKEKYQEDQFSATDTIYNTKSGLPHLLEYGHQTRNGGRTKPQTHIKPNEEKANTDLEKRISKRLSNGY